MAQMTPERLQQLREEKRREMRDRRNDAQCVEIIVGMGTSGIAAGANKTLLAFRDKLQEHSIHDAVLREAGSLGLDHAEPTVEIKMSDMPDTIYGRVTPEIAEQIVEKHIINKELVNKHVFDRPAPDMM